MASLGTFGSVPQSRMPCPSDYVPDDDGTDPEAEALAELLEDQSQLSWMWADLVGPRVATWDSPQVLCTPEVDAQSLETHDLHALLIHPDTPREALMPVLVELRSRFEKLLEREVQP